MMKPGSIKSFVSTINFSWERGNALLFASIVSLFAFVLFSPLIVLSVVHHRPLFALLPFVIALGFGLVFAATSSGMNAAVLRLRRRMDDRSPDDVVFDADCTIVRGIIQSPGVVQIRGNVMTLVPVVGSAINISLDDLRTVQETTSFNGTRLFGNAKGFWLKRADGERLGCERLDFKRLGVAVDDGDALRSLLSLRDGSHRFVERDPQSIEC